jgi:DNA invertase Pin-like site-specific DNA recombinase
LEAQRAAVANYLNGGQWTFAAEYVEVEGGKRNDRPQLAAALALCKKLKANKLDRLSRNLAFLAKLIESGVTFVAADMRGRLRPVASQKHGAASGRLSR